MDYCQQNRLIICSIFELGGFKRLQHVARSRSRILMLLTAARHGETLKAQWPHIHFKTGAAALLEANVPAQVPTSGVSESMRSLRAICEGSEPPTKASGTLIPLSFWWRANSRDLSAQSRCCDRSDADWSERNATNS